MSGRAKEPKEDGEQAVASSPRVPASPFTGGAAFSRSMSHAMRTVAPSNDGLQSHHSDGGSRRGWGKVRGVARGMGVMGVLASSRLRSTTEGNEEAEGGEEPIKQGNDADLEAPLLPRDSQRTTGSGVARQDSIASQASSHSTEGEVPATTMVIAARCGRKMKPEMMVSTGPTKAIVIGAINALVGIPAQTAFATIVFQDPMYAPYLGDLCKFFFFASGVHQIVFMLLSTLPYAVGQVQDVGLIFLSSMATSIAAICGAAGLGAKEALGTTLLTTCIATFIVGLLTLMVGRFKLAGLVQYVPLPVIGGYLGYVGYFIVAGGAGLVTGVQLDGILNWLEVFTVERLIKLLPMFASTFIITRSLHFHPIVLPLTLMSIPALFHLVLLATGTSLAWCQENDWVMKPMPGNQHFWDLWRYFNIDMEHGIAGVFSAVHWPALVAQLAKIVGLFLVVCFGSGMDVAAIQQDSPTPLNFNQELVTVGASNMVTAMLGAGYTGSYIFSQTIFTMKAGITSNLSGLVIAVVELSVFALPFSVVQYVPKFFFGALLLWFGVDIVKDWLFESVKKLSKPEYVLLWLTFLAIMWWGLELGIGAGIVMVTLVFAYEYAQSTVSSLNPVSVTSGTVYSYSHMTLLDLMLPRRVVGLSLSGFLFFGNSISISDRIEEIADQMIERAEAEANMLDPCAPSEITAERSQTEPMPSLNLDSPASEVSDAASKRLAFARSGRSSLYARSEATRGTGGNRRNAAHAMDRVMLSQLVDAPMFVILDFRLVPRLDSTGAKTFATLASKLENKGVQVLVCGLPADKSSPIRMLLNAHALRLVERAAPDSVCAEYANFAADPEPQEEPEEEQVLRPGETWEFPSLELASKFCEDQIMELAVERSLVDSTQSAVPLEDVLRMHVDSMPGTHVDPLAALLKRYMTTINLKRGQVLFRAGDTMSGLHIVESGKLHLFTSGAAVSNGGALGSGPSAALLPILEHQKSNVGETEKGRAVEHGPGSLVCPHDFALRRPFSATARCFTPTARVMLLPVEAFERLMTDAPQPLNALQVALTRSLSLDLASSLGLTDRVGSTIGGAGASFRSFRMAR